MKQLVIGLGESGLAMVRHAVRVGVSVAVYDSRSEPVLLPLLHERYVDVPAFCGTFDPIYLDGVTEVVVSPGLSPHVSPLNDILNLACERNIVVLGELDLFTRALTHMQLTEQYEAKVLAITGTNGKTTVAALTQHLCVSAGVTAHVAGNISPSMLDALSDAIEANDLPAIWVLELSSFQLQFAHGFNPYAATVLNVSQDHLDWHSDEAEYVQSKTNIFGEQTIQVLNRDDAIVMGMKRDGATAMSFGSSQPEMNENYGLCVDGAMEWLSVANNILDDEPIKKRAKDIVVDSPLIVKRLMPMNALKIHGRHNAMNALAALALCRSINLPLSKLLHGLRSYAGEAHRLQFISNVNGVDFYDDSKGTNVGATLAALNGLNRSIILIAGGDGKGQDFSPLCDAIKRHVKRIELIGKDAMLMQSVFYETGVGMNIHESLEDATLAAAQSAESGDVVLLSPACASLDMFKNYGHRAQVFIESVHAWALNQGQI